MTSNRTRYEQERAKLGPCFACDQHIYSRIARHEMDAECEHCGEPFEMNRRGPIARFCSTRCRVAAHRAIGTRNAGGAA